MVVVVVVGGGGGDDDGMGRGKEEMGARERSLGEIGRSQAQKCIDPSWPVQSPRKYWGP